MPSAAASGFFDHKIVTFQVLSAVAILGYCFWRWRKSSRDTISNDERSSLIHGESESTRSSIVEENSYQNTTQKLPRSSTCAPEDQKGINQSREIETLNSIHGPEHSNNAGVSSTNFYSQDSSRSIAQSQSTEGGLIKAEVDACKTGDHLNASDLRNEHKKAKVPLSNGYEASSATAIEERNLRDASTVTQLESGQSTEMSRLHSQDGRGDQSEGALERRAPQEHRRSLDACKVFVSNISYSVRTSELKDFFRYFGRVTQVNLLKDRNRKLSRGLAFVTFGSPEEAERARNGTTYELTMDGRVMKCSTVERKSRRREQEEAMSTSSGKQLLTPNTSATSNTTENAKDQNVDKSLHDGMKEEKEEEEEEVEENGMDGSFEDDAPINALPDFILMDIFSYFGMKQRIRIESVCRRWRRVCMATWKSQQFLHFSDVFQGFTFSRDGVVALNDAILKSILSKGCQNLRHLDLSASPRFLTARSMNCIGSTCRELKYLNMSNSKVDNSCIKNITNGCRKIETVILKKCHGLGEKGIWWLFHNCDDLIHVDLEDNRRINGKCFHILSKHCKAVRLVGCTSLNDKGLGCLVAKCGESLEELNISECLCIKDEGFKNLTQRCQNLKILSFCGVHTQVTSVGLQSLTNLKNLHTLHLTNNQRVNDAVLTKVALHCKGLRELRLDGCSFVDITDAGIQVLARCPELVVLNISYLGKMTSEGLKPLALAGRLQKLVARSLHITDDAIKLLAAHCLQLTDLDVCGCSELTIATIRVLLEARNTLPVESRRPTLTLSFGGTAVTVESLEELGEIDPDVTICLQNLTAPPGQYYPAILPLEENWEESSEDDDDEGEGEDEDAEMENIDRASILLPTVPPTYPANLWNHQDEVEYLQVPADSDEPWDGVLDPVPSDSHSNELVVAQPDCDEHMDGVLNPEPSVLHSDGPVVAHQVSAKPLNGVLNPEPSSAHSNEALDAQTGASSTTYSESSQIEYVHKEDLRGVLNQELSSAELHGAVVREQTSAGTHPVPSETEHVDNISSGDLNPKLASAEPNDPVVRGPGYFAHANPELAQFEDVEEDLIEGARGDYGGWAIAEEDVDDFLDADDPAFVDDIMYRS